MSPLSLLPSTVTSKAAGLPQAVPFVPSAWLAPSERSGNGAPMGTRREPSTPRLAPGTSFLFVSFQPCAERRGSVLCGSRKRRDPCKMVAMNTFINHSSAEACGIATGQGAPAERPGECKGPDDGVSLVSQARPLGPRESGSVPMAPEPGAHFSGLLDNFIFNIKTYR